MRHSAEGGTDAGGSADRGTGGAGSSTGGLDGTAGSTDGSGGLGGTGGSVGGHDTAEAGEGGYAEDSGGASGSPVSEDTGGSSAGGGSGTSTGGRSTGGNGSDAGGAGGAEGSVGANADSPLGINLASVTYYSRQWTFLDLTKMGGSFAYAASPGATDEHGWVLDGDVGLFLCTGLEGHYPGGRYVVLYDGEADLSTRTTIWDANGDEMSNDAVLDSAASAPGRAVLDITPSNSGFVLSWDNINPSDPMRDVRIVPEPNEHDHATQVFHPTFLASIERFSTLRFMDLMRTNDSAQGSWADRPRRSDALQGTDRGVALEYLIALANRVHADPWFTIPHLADDDYVRNFAAMVRDGLADDLRVYVEYSNEVWNSGFGQYEYARSRGEAANLGTDRDAADRFYARRSLEIFALFEETFAETGRRGLAKVIASQNSPYWALRMMDWIDPQTNRRPIEDADYWALAPYFCGSPPDDPASVDALLDHCEASISDVLASATEIANAARSFGVPVIAYEGGQHIRNDGASSDVQTLYDLANDAPRMGELYTRYLDRWRADVGGQMFALFSLVSGQSVYGRWGILEAQDDTDYPKYRAAMDFITDNPIWW